MKLEITEDALLAVLFLLGNERKTYYYGATQPVKYEDLFNNLSKQYLEQSLKK